MRGRSVAVDDDAVLQQGLQAFAELGYDGTSMRILAQRLGVSHNFINDRYGSKAEFWNAVMGSALQQMTTRLTEVLDADFDDDADRLAEVVRRFYRQVAREPLLNQIMFDETSRNSPRLAYLQERYVAPVFATVEPYLENLMTAGRITCGPKHLYLLAVMGPITALMNQHRRLDTDRPIDDLLAAADTLAEITLTGLTPRQ